MTLFKDVVHSSGKTTSTTVSQTLRISAVKHITGASSTPSPSSVGDIVVICQDGQIACLSGEELKLRWSAPTKSAVQDVVSGTIDELDVEYVSSGTMTDFRDGAFKNRLELFSSLPRALDADPTLLFVVAKSTSQGHTSRHIAVLAATEGNSSTSSELQKLIPLDISPLPSQLSSGDGDLVYEVDIQSGLLLVLIEGQLNVYDITSSVPKKKTSVHMDGAESFARLSRPFILATSADSAVLYNYQYRSIHARANLDLSDLSEVQQIQSCQLITYLRSQDLMVALVDNVLISIHVEPPMNHGKRRREGLLIDSIGRGASTEVQSKRVKGDASSKEFSNLLPGTMTEAYLAKFHGEVQNADKLLANNELVQWEDILRRKFRMNIRNDTENGRNEASPQDNIEWSWRTEADCYPPVDRRWVLYAISRIFAIEITASDEPRPELKLVLPDSNVATYLVVAGHLTISNIVSSLREDLTADDSETTGLARDLVQCLSNADPSMSLLLNYLQATKLGEAELLLAIRRLMLSMDLLKDMHKIDTTKLLTGEAHDETEKYEMDLDDLEREIAVTEHYLGDDSSSRSRGLTLAFAKLWRLPAVSTVKALRSTIPTNEIVSFIALLRVELLRGAWTTLYIDPTNFDSEGNDPPPDGVIALIADLLGRCLDAMGAGGWLFNDALIWADKGEAGDLLTALQLEVTAALEGIEEAVYLNGIVGEAVRFGLTASKSWAARQTWHSSKAISTHMNSRESALLPLGLRTKLLPTRDKVVSGGEVVQRSVRETGHLISQKVEAYSLEKLAI